MAIAANRVILVLVIDFNLNFGFSMIDRYRILLQGYVI